MTTAPSAAPSSRGAEGYNSQENDEKLTEYTWDEVARHNREEDLWVVIYNRIYDVTDFQIDHPGGPDVLQDIAAQNATEEFENILHTEKARKMAKRFLIGKIKGTEVGDLFAEVRPLNSGSSKTDHTENDASMMNTVITLGFLGLAAIIGYQYYMK